MRVCDTLLFDTFLNELLIIRSSGSLQQYYVNCTSYNIVECLQVVGNKNCLHSAVAREFYNLVIISTKRVEQDECCREFYVSLFLEIYN